MPVNDTMYLSIDDRTTIKDKNLWNSTIVKDKNLWNSTTVKDNIKI